MQYRKFGKTGLTVSEIGFGAWGIGASQWIGADDNISLKAMHRAIDLGVNFIDTALAYGKGHSEELVGKLLKERKDKIIVATKIPPKNLLWPPKPGTNIQEVFPYEHIIKSTETSLKNLGVDTINLQQLHVWNDDWTDLDEWKNAITKLKTEGKIQHLGISINNHQPNNSLKVASTGLVDSFQVIYNIFDQTPEQELFPYCQKNNIAIIARVPFDEGSLTGKITSKTVFPENDFRNFYFSPERKILVEERINELKKLLGDEAKTLPELALRFCLHHPAVSTVIPGMRSIENVEFNCKISDNKKLSNAMIEKLKKHAWNKNFYQQ